MAVITGDEKALIAAPGIGKKISQRIILELKDKLTKEQQEIGMPTAPGIVAGEKSKTVEAAAALAVLGYTQQDIAVAMKGIDARSSAARRDRAPELKENGKIGETINERKYKRGG